MAFALSDLTLTSSAFADGSAIPTRNTGEGENVSPALSWTNAPEGTAGYVVFCHDPDAPLVEPRSYGFVHWVLYNLPASVTSLEEGSTVGTPGLNNKGDAAYTGPMPPNGHGVHRYYFWVCALDTELALDPGLTLWELLAQIEPHVTGMNRLVGTYKRD